MITPRLAIPLATLFLAPGLATAQTLSPEEAVKRMKVADGFEVKIVAAEPMVRQPVSISFDDRGRVWVVQYLQYPAPAGLKPVKVDQFLRTVYDRVPEPPPKGPKGADRITILSDFDKDGRARKSKDFVTGLNLCSGMCLGHGGVYVLQVPYLLFYPDKDGDDVPDGDPEVLLKGFGMEDAHALANSLQWGPDGWLYGAQGSTVTANVRGIEFQQGIWRYHPITKEFELFSEGGGNTWGLDFDAHGNVIAGTNWGGSAMLHQVQGGYYIKGFGKHGPLHNPNTYGYFDHIPYKDFRGGHVTCGGIVYHGGAYPARYEGQYVAGNLLSNVLHWHVLEQKGSSFISHFGSEFLVANDPRFRPVDCLTGPDGAVYVADWYDIRANHVDPVDNWDKATGRIYKIVAKGGEKFATPSLAKRTSQELVQLLDHPNDWYHREARRILAERRDPAVLPGLKKTILVEKGPLALESLWALYVSGGFDDAFAAKLFDHSNEDVCAWTVRLLGDAKKVSPGIAAQLTELARKEPSPTVRSQLACSAKRLPGKDCLPIVRELLRHKEDVSDPHIPLLLWWAVEDKAIRDRELVLGLLDTPEAWQVPLIRQYLVERLGRRYMTEGSEADYATCARLLAAAPGPDEVKLLVQGMEKALEGRQLPKVPAVLEKQLGDLWAKQSPTPLLVRFALRLGSPQGYERALAIVADSKAPEADRSNLIETLGQAGKAECVPVLLRVLAETKGDGVRGAALTALQGFTDERITPAVLDAYPKLSAGLRGRAQTLLCSRPASALAFLQAVDAGTISAKEVPLDPLRRVAGYKDERLTKLIEKHWGKVGPLPPGEKVARINAIRHSLGQRPGDLANGKILFTKTCATCHVLFGEGNKVGPELTGADRKNRDFLLTSIVDPSAYIRPEFVAWVVNLKDGRALTGLVAESSPKAVTLLNEKNERTVLARDKIDDMAASPVSLMPEKILDPLSEQEIRDLFAYLQSDGLSK
jgi:putative membrane-bound dehydrogenase-like protein